MGWRIGWGIGLGRFYPCATFDIDSAVVHKHTSYTVHSGGFIIFNKCFCIEFGVDFNQII